MATAIMPRAASAEIKLEYGVPKVFALRFTSGKNVEGRYGPRVLFTCVDERKIWLDAEDGSDLERELRALDIQPADFIRVTKVRMPRGGGHALRVERVEDEQPPQRIPAASAPSSPQTTAPAAAPRAPQMQVRAAAPEHDIAPALPPASTAMCSAMCAAVDAVIETQAYAARRGLGVTFSEESVRAIGLSIYIGAQRGGAR